MSIVLSKVAEISSWYLKKRRLIWNFGKLWQTLEDNFFVAINSIELSDDYNLLIAKKMHGWGGWGEKLYWRVWV